MGFIRRILARPYPGGPLPHQNGAAAERRVARPLTGTQHDADATPMLGPPDRVVYLARDVAAALGRIAWLRAHGIDVYVGLGMGIPDDAEVVIDAGCGNATLPFRHWAEMLRPYGFSREILFLGHTTCLIVEVNGASPAQRCHVPTRTAQLAWLRAALQPVPESAELVGRLVH